MHPIRKPELLDPDRPLDPDRDTGDDLAGHRSRDEQLEVALRESCAYAAELWQHLDMVRGYLVDSLPSDPRAPGETPHACASPIGPDDETGWARWIEAYATATSALAGPQGDSGFGLSEANDAARLRREAPNLAVLTRPARPEPSNAEASGTRPTDRGARGRSGLRLAVLAALVALAVRGRRR